MFNDNLPSCEINDFGNFMILDDDGCITGMVNANRAKAINDVLLHFERQSSKLHKNPLIFSI